MDAHLNAAPAATPIDLQRLDATLASLHRTERDVAFLVTSLAEARDALTAAPGDPEAARRVTMAELRMRGSALALSQDLAALAQPEA